MADDSRIGSLVEERYKILEAMATGSMGAVYRAERVPVGKAVAIKFLHASFANEPEFLIRFERETRVMSKLAHPNCVSVVDFGVWQDAPYLVMELVAGTTLRALLDDGPLEPFRALGLMRQIASGLAHAHAQEIVHRDIKPANLMISDEIGTGEHVRILDFGLARLRTGGGRDATQSNVVVGTPNYMAPEQTVGGGAIDARTDIYAAGVVLFEMVTGERPFAADDTLQLLGMHRHAKIPRLAERMPGVDLPEGLQEVIDKAMAKRPDERFQTAIELATAIDAILDPRPAELRVSGSRPVARRKSAIAVAPTGLDATAESGPPVIELTRWRGTLLIALLLLGGIGATAAYLIVRSSNPPVADASGPRPGDAAASALAIPPGPPLDGAAAELDAPVAFAALDDAALDAPLDDATPAAAALADAAAVDAADEIEMDPETAEDLDPSKEATASASEEAPNAPSTKEDVEAQAPPQPVQATTIHDAVLLIKDGKRELALTSLRALEKANPNSAYIPFLLGNLYADKLWWAVAMDNYRVAIGKNAGYRGNPTLNRNVIRMLASPKTQRKAQAFLHFIGHPAAAYLKVAARSDANPIVRSQASQLARAIR